MILLEDDLLKKAVISLYDWPEETRQEFYSKIEEQIAAQKRQLAIKKIEEDIEKQRALLSSLGFPVEGKAFENWEVHRYAEDAINWCNTSRPGIVAPILLVKNISPEPKRVARLVERTGIKITDKRGSTIKPLKCPVYSPPKASAYAIYGIFIIEKEGGVSYDSISDHIRYGKQGLVPASLPDAISLVIQKWKDLKRWHQVPLVIGGSQGESTTTLMTINKDEITLSDVALTESPEGKWFIWCGGYCVPIKLEHY